MADKRSYIKWTSQEIQTLVVLMLRMQLNDEKKFLRLLNKAQDSLPKDRRRSIRSKVMVPKGVIARYDELVDRIKKEILSDQLSEQKPKEPLLADATPKELATEVGRRLGVPEPVVSIQVPSAENGSGKNDLRLRITLEEESKVPQIKLPRVLVIGVWPREAGKFDCFATRVKLDLRSPEDHAGHKPTACDLCVVVNSTSNWWKKQVAKLDPHYVTNVKEAVAVVQRFIDKGKV